MVWAVVPSACGPWSNRLTPRLTHVRLLVDNYRECHRFYREVLGLTPRFGGVESVYEEFAAGGAGGVVLSLYQRGMMASVLGTGHLPTRAAGQDVVALTFAVESVDAAYDALTAMGIKFLGPPTDKPEWLLRVVHLRDPAGNLIELNAPLGAERAEEGEVDLE